MKISKMGELLIGKANLKGGEMESVIIPIPIQFIKKNLLEIDQLPSWSKNFLQATSGKSGFDVLVRIADFEEKLTLIAELDGNAAKIVGHGSGLLKTLELNLNVEGISDDSTKISYTLDFSTPMPMPRFMKKSIEARFIDSLLADLKEYYGGSHE